MALAPYNFGEDQLAFQIAVIGAWGIKEGRNEQIKQDKDIPGAQSQSRLRHVKRRVPVPLLLGMVSIHQHSSV